MSVGDRIKYYRELRGLTQIELADRVQIGYATISKWETGVIKNIPIDRLNSIAKALDTTTGVLLGIEPDLIDGVVTDVQKEIESLLPYLSEYQQSLLLQIIKEFR